jgi:hypothetical protein
MAGPARGGPQSMTWSRDCAGTIRDGVSVGSRSRGDIHDPEHGFIQSANACTMIRSSIRSTI